MSSFNPSSAAVPKVVALGDICSLSYGKALPKESRNPQGAFPAVGSAGIVSYTDNALVSDPALVVGRKGNVGSIQVFDSGCFPLDTTFVIRPHDQVNLNYLAWALRSRNLVGLDSSTTLPSLRRQDLEAVRLPVPPLDEQKRIVAEIEDQLGRLDATRTQLAESRTRLEQLRASALNQSLGSEPQRRSDEIFQLRDLVLEVTPGFASGAHNSKGTGIPHLRPMNVSSRGAISLDTVKSVLADVNSKRLTIGDVVFNNTNSPDLVGKTALFAFPGEYAFSNHMTRIRVKHELLDPAFLASFLHSKWRDGTFKKLCSNHVNQASISRTVLERIDVPLPPLGEQRRIVAELEEIQASLDLIGARLSEVDSLVGSARAAVLHRAFSGGRDD